MLTQEMYKDAAKSKNNFIVIKSLWKGVDQMGLPTDIHYQPELVNYLIEGC